MRIIRFPLLLALALWLTGCQKEVDDPYLRQAASKLVVFSFISPQDTLLTVRVTQPTPFFGSVAQPGGAVINATVRLSDGTTSTELAHRTEGTYTVSATQFPILPGRTYLLTVTTPDGLRAQSACTVPLRANDAITLVQVDPFPGGVEQIEGYFLHVEWQDAPGEGDYYRIFAEPPTLFYHRKSPGQPDQVDTLLQPAILFQQGEVYTKDAGQDGQKFRVAQGGFVTGGSFNNVDNYIQFERKVNVVLLTTDQAYYQYHRSLERAEGADPDPFGEPILVFNNVEGGFGVFAAYQKYEKAVWF